MVKKVVLAVGIIIPVVVAGIFFYSPRPRPSVAPTPSPTSSPTPLPPIKFIPVSAAPQQTLFSPSDGSYQILYTSYNSLYLISILKQPYADIRQQAEEKLLELLNLPKDEACSLNLLITAPYYAHREIIPDATSFTLCSSQ